MPADICGVLTPRITLLNALHASSQLIPPKTLWHRYYYYPFLTRENWDTRRLKNWLKFTKQVNAERLETWPVDLLNHALTCKATWKKQQTLVLDTAQPLITLGSLATSALPWVNRIGLDDLSCVPGNLKLGSPNLLYVEWPQGCLQLPQRSASWTVEATGSIYANLILHGTLSNSWHCTLGPCLCPTRNPWRQRSVIHHCTPSPCLLRVLSMIRIQWAHPNGLNELQNSGRNSWFVVYTTV